MFFELFKINLVEGIYLTKYDFDKVNLNIFVNWLNESDLFEVWRNFKVFNY